MEEFNDIDFLFDISSQIKEFYETAAVFITKKDYSDHIFTALCSIREALQNKDKNRTLEVIIDYHLHWLHAVSDVENFKKSIEKDITRDDMSELISYTVDALGYRLKRFQNYVQSLMLDLKPEDRSKVQADLEIISEMNSDVTKLLLEKTKKLRSLKSDLDFFNKSKAEVDELLNWLDKINDGLSIKLCKYVNVHIPKLNDDLTKTLQQIVEELKTKKSESAQKMLDELRTTGKELGSMIHLTTGHSLEMNKVFQKIGILDDRIKRLETDSDKPSAALMALKHKKEFLEQRIVSLENLKTDLRSLRTKTAIPVDSVPDEELCVCEDFFQLRIFNHSLPQENREILITDLCSLWDVAVLGEKGDKSIISILSAADMKEEYTDELGTFTTDEHGRKIYRLPDDDTLYQLNERNELVPVTDDVDCVYFYDECGRYFLDKNTRQRVYKAHATASEYMMDSFGVLLKVKEERDGITFYYDNYGRYYINEEGKHIYRDVDTTSEYENDGLGNLVRIRSHLDLYEPCPGDAHVTEDCKYLKHAVGKALRYCIGQVLIHQPADPIKYLSKCLIKYRENMEQRDKRAREREELNAEREIIAAEERAAAEKAAMEAALLTQGGSEASIDTNLLKYTTLYRDDVLSTTN